MFKNLNYKEYIKKFPFHKRLGIELESYGDVALKKQNDDPYYNVSKDLSEPFSAELDDLIRLHYLLTSRKVSTVLEFGVGKSTCVFDDALSYNKKHYKDYISKHLRRSNAFECHSVDDDEKWLDFSQKSYATKNVFYHFSPVKMDTFNGRICTFYESLPNICPDFIYLDAPGLYSVKGEVRGISTAHTDRLPMAADILAFEHFLLPGTLIAVDGRSANARFLKANLQREWKYSYFKEYDQHFFELVEEPLGIYNEKQIAFCLAGGGGIENFRFEIFIFKTAFRGCKVRKVA